MSAPPPAIAPLPPASTKGFVIGGSGAVKTLDSTDKSGDSNFDLAAFVASQQAPIVVVKYEADFCQGCKDIAPLFERLAGLGAPAIASFTVNVEKNEDIGEASGIQNLPTFKFFTTKLSPKGEFLCIDVLEGANGQSLQEKFGKAIEVVNAVLSKNQPRQPAPQQAAVQPAPPQVSHPAAAPASARLNVDQVKRELVDIRTVLLATVQRVEKLYHAL